MADLIVMPVSDNLKDSTYTAYDDGAAGTLGMCTVVEERVHEADQEHQRGK